MVKAREIQISVFLRRVQALHTVATLVFLTYIALSPAFYVTLDSGQSFRILSTHGPLGQLLFWSAALVVIGQILGYRRFTIASGIAYASVGATYVFLGLSVPAGESLLNMQMDSTSSAVNWIARELSVNFDLAEVDILIGPVWHLLLLAGVSLICIALALLIDASRNRQKIFLDESFD